LPINSLPLWRLTLIGRSRSRYCRLENANRLCSVLRIVSQVPSVFHRSMDLFQSKNSSDHAAVSVYYLRARRLSTRRLPTSWSLSDLSARVILGSAEICISCLAAALSLCAEGKILVQLLRNSLKILRLLVGHIARSCLYDCSSNLAGFPDRPGTERGIFARLFIFRYAFWRYANDGR